MLEQVVEHDLERPRLEEGGAGFSRHGDERQEHLGPVGPQERGDREGSRWQGSGQRCHAGIRSGATSDVIWSTVEHVLKRCVP